MKNFILTLLVLFSGVKSFALVHQCGLYTSAGSASKTYTFYQDTNSKMMYFCMPNKNRKLCQKLKVTGQENKLSKVHNNIFTTTTYHSNDTNVIFQHNQGQPVHYLMVANHTYNLSCKF